MIHDIALGITGGVERKGYIDVTGGVIDGAGGSTLANKDGDPTMSRLRLIVHRMFVVEDVAISDISKEFSMFTGEDVKARVFVSHFDQTISQVLEPTSVIKLGVEVGAAALVAARRRRIRD